MPISALPKIAYEFNNSGADAAGFGPTLTGGTYASGLLSQALAAGATASSATTLGVSIADGAAWSFGQWFKVDAASEDVFDALANITLNSSSKLVAVTIANNGGFDATVQIETETVNLGTLSVGWHHIGISRSSGNTATVYLDGVATGTPFTYSVPTASGSSSFVSNGYGCLLDQAVIADVAYSAADWLYIVNGGSGIAYASMSTTGGGAGARFAGSLFLLGVGN